MGVRISPFMLFWLGVVENWRNPHSLAMGVVLVVASSLGASLGLAATAGAAQLSGDVWSLLFWLLFLFISLLLGGDMARLRPGMLLFYFLVADGWVLWVVRALQLVGWLLLFAVGALALQNLWLEVPVVRWGALLWVVAVGAVGFAAVLTTIGLLVSRLEGGGVLFAVLSLPLLIPLLVFCVRATQTCVLPLAAIAASGNDNWRILGVLGGFVLLVMSLSLLLFPYLWRG